jgi:2-oxoglutarate/2-oxoacid ferredoxin oxidoreductase subunit beta
MEGLQVLTPKDFKSDQEVRWCPGCGDHAVLNAVQRAMAELEIPKEKFAVVSGIGCSSRFPYYMNTYGFHSIHGRAGAIASGVKVANPDLCVWQITGDGDALAIGGNHFIHEIRRNVDLNLVLFNNEIYGLTKGQFSPTSQEGAVTKTSPFGTVEAPFKPGELVIGAQGKFFARSIDGNLKLTAKILVEAAKFKGTSVVEVMQNCVIYNDKFYAAITDRTEKENRQLVVRHGEKMIFGKENNMGIVQDGLGLKVVTIGEGGYTEDDILVHDAKDKNPFIHMMLVNMNHPEFPVVFGVIRAVEDSTYDEKVDMQIEAVQATSKIKNMDDLMNSGNTWVVK